MATHTADPGDTALAQGLRDHMCCWRSKNFFITRAYTGQHSKKRRKKWTSYVAILRQSVDYLVIKFEGETDNMVTTQWPHTRAKRISTSSFGAAMTRETKEFTKSYLPTAEFLHKNKKVETRMQPHWVSGCVSFVSQAAYFQGKLLTHYTGFDGSSWRNSSRKRPEKRNLFKTISFCPQFSCIVIICYNFNVINTSYFFLFGMQVSQNIFNFAPWPTKPKMFIICPLQKKLPTHDLLDGRKEEWENKSLRTNTKIKWYK